jgi:subfamily B ATP-binding cassette protein MsbA
VKTNKIPIRKYFKKTSFWRDNGLIFRELKHFRWLVAIALICTILGASLEGITVGFIASFVQGLTNPNEPPIQSGIQWFDVWFLATKAPTTERIYRLAALILLLVWLHSIFLYLGRFYSGLSALKLVGRIRKLLFEQLQSLSLSFYSKSRSGELINSITTEGNQLIQAFDAATVFMTKSITVFAYIVAMFCLSWQLSIAAVMAFALLSAGLSNLVKWVREASFAIPKANGQLTSVSVETIEGIRTVQASVTQDFERKRFDRATDAVTQAKKKVLLLSELLKPLAEGVASTILIVIVTASFMMLVQGGELRSSSLLAFMFVLFRMMPLVSLVNSSVGKFNSYQGALNNIQQLIRRDDKVYLENGTIAFTGLTESIDFISVYFGYEGNAPVLQNICLSIPKGQTTALVGASGAGKTTLAELIPRFYDPIQGWILIDGIDLRGFEIDSLRRKMAIVSQETFIFNTSVRNNIAYGLENIDRETVIKAAKLANAWEFIKDLPEGLETQLGDRGVRLSGGQRQRIAIARALLRDPEILILDEATSALDSVTERLIQESLERLSQGRTVIAIAHRLSTIIQADKVVVLEEGRIVEEGKYHELLELRGKLWKYHQIQNEGRRHKEKSQKS